MAHRGLVPRGSKSARGSSSHRHRSKRFERSGQCRKRRSACPAVESVDDLIEPDPKFVSTVKILSSKEYRNAYTRLTTLAKDRVDKGLVNTTARASYGLINVKPKTAHEMAADRLRFGVLWQDDDVTTWEPKLPTWKMEAILSMTMVSDPILLHLMSVAYTPHTGYA